MATSLGAQNAITFADSIPAEWILPARYQGDLLDSRAQRDLVDLVGESTCDLVTSDGGFDVDHTKLESETAALAQAATDVAVDCLASGGTLVLKVFECNLPVTIRLLAHICTMFDNVSIIKPSTSRATNSERYIVACGFHSRNPPPQSMPASWLRSVIQIIEQLNADQIKTLEAVTRRCR